MAENSKIEWTDHTFNPWWGCTKVSPACDHCYAEAWAKRTGHQVWGNGAPRRLLSADYWKQPLRWNKAAADSGTRSRVFCASMADVFEWKKELGPLRSKLWDLIDETPNLDWLLLTKRPHLATRLTRWGADWPRNVWLGTTAENQKWADKRLKKFDDVPARIKFLSCEPLLGPIDLSEHLDRGAIDWVISGGESGPNARPTDPEWFRSLRDQCIHHDVPFHFKQWGDWAPAPEQNCELIAATKMRKLSVVVMRSDKKRNGRILDGATWDELPSTT